MPDEPFYYRRHLAACGQSSRTYTLCSCPIWLEFYDPAGRRQRVSLRTTDWSKAPSRARLIAGGGEFLPPDTTGLTLGPAVKRFLADCKARALEPSTIDVYRLVLDHLIEFASAGRSLSTIDLDLISRYRTTRKVAASTQRKELERIRTFLGWCEDHGLITANPVRGRRLRLPKVDDLVTQPLTRDEVVRLLTACSHLASDDPVETPWVRRRAKALVLTLSYSGLRISDITRLLRTALEPSGHLVLRTKKNGVPVKVLLHRDAVDALTSLPLLGESPYFFWTGVGDPITCTKNLRRTIGRIGKLAKVGARPHRFRDTFAVELLSNGADIRTVQQLLGHTSVRTTEKHYAHFVAAHQKLLDTAAATLDFSPKAARPLLVKPAKNRRRNP